MKVWLRSVGGLPGRIKAWLDWPFDTKEIGAPDRSGVEGLREAFHGDGQFGGPCFFRFIDVYAALQTAFYVLKRSVSNFQIDPQAVGAYLEFLVTARLLRIRLQENLSDIAIPKLIAAAVSVGIFEDGDESIASDKFHIEKFWCPEEADFGLAMRIGIFSLPVTVEVNGLCGAPRFGRRKGSGIE